MRKFQCLLFVLKWSCICYHIICIIVPLKCVVRLLMLEKPKLSFYIGSVSIKANIELSGRKSKNTPETFPQSLLSGWSFGDMVNWWFGSYFLRAMRGTWATEREIKCFTHEVLMRKRSAYVSLAYHIYGSQIWLNFSFNNFLWICEVCA